jgi:hypothetical protein
MHRAPPYCTHALLHVRCMSHRTYCTCIARHRIASCSIACASITYVTARMYCTHYALHASHVLHCTNAPHVLHCSTYRALYSYRIVPYRILLHVRIVRTNCMSYALHRTACTYPRTHCMYVRSYVRIMHVCIATYSIIALHCITCIAYIAFVCNMHALVLQASYGNDICTRRISHVYVCMGAFMYS